MTTTERLDRIRDEAEAILTSDSYFDAPQRAAVILESLTALREQVTEMERDDVTLRRRIHQVEEHNQFFERCESGWCNPDAAADPSSRGVGAAWKTPAEYDQQIATLTAAERDQARAEDRVHSREVTWAGERIATLESARDAAVERVGVLERALREVPAIIQSEAYLPKFAPGSEDEPSCEGAKSGWCQSALDAACDIRNRTLARAAALSTAAPKGTEDSCE